jgi:hypothetical protein
MPITHPAHEAMLAGQQKIEYGQLPEGVDEATAAYSRGLAPGHISVMGAQIEAVNPGNNDRFRGGDTHGPLTPQQ